MKLNFLKRLLTLTVAASMVMSSMNVMAAEVDATEAVVEAVVNEVEDAEVDDTESDEVKTDVEIEAEDESEIEEIVDVDETDEDETTSVETNENLSEPATEVDTNDVSDAEEAEMTDAVTDGATVQNMNSGIMVVDETGNEETHYYNSRTDASNALVSYCNIPTSGTNEAQEELIAAFLEKWIPKAYAAKDESEANSILAQAKAAWSDVLKQINDENAMAERDEFLKLRETKYQEKDAIYSKWVNGPEEAKNYTKVSVADCVSKMENTVSNIRYADTKEDLDKYCTEFDAILDTYLVKLEQDVLDARTNAHADLVAYFKNELASLNGVNWNDTIIDEYETVAEITNHVTEQKANMLAYVESHLGDYFEKLCDDLYAACKAKYSFTKDQIQLLVSTWADARDARKDSIASKTDAETKAKEVETITNARAEEIANGSVPATSLTVGKTEVEMEVEDRVYFESLNIVVGPNNTTDTLSYKSSNESVFTIDAGKKSFKARGEGTATLTITCGSLSKQVTVVVKAKTVNVESVSLNKSTLTLKVDDTEKLTVTITPSNATNQTATWTSSNTSVATVANDGTITALATGSTTITVTVDDKSATCNVMVEAKEPTTTDPDNGKINVESVTLDKNTLSLEVDDTDTLTATVNPTNATDNTVTWTSSDPTVATVSNGLVNALTAGKTTITAMADGKSATCEVTVTAKAEAPGNTKVDVTSVTLNKNVLSLKTNETDTLTATVAPSDATDKEITWTSSNPAVATVDSNGKVTAVSEGSTTITATADGQKDTCVVTVTKADESNGTTNPGTTPGTGNESNSGNSNTSSGSSSSSSSSNKTESDTSTTYVESHPAYTSATVSNSNGIENLSIRYQRMDTPDLTAYQDAIGDTTVACFFDITAWISGSNATELGKDVEITIQIPSEFLKEGRTFYLIRNHEGKIVRLNDVDSNANTITVRTSDFSGYLLTYSDNATTTSSSPKTGDNMNVFGYMAVAFISMVGMTYCFEKREEDEF